jgi:clan AA aspartic protease
MTALWNFLGGTPVMRVKIVNPFMHTSYPTEGDVVAVVDTGYSGFLLVPTRLFNGAGLDGLRHYTADAVVADQRHVKLTGAHATMVIPDLSLEVDGLVETNDHIKEVLVGMDGLHDMALLLNCCEGELSARICRVPS